MVELQEFAGVVSDMKVTIINEKLGMLCFEMTANGIIGTGQEFPRDEKGNMSKEGACVKPSENDILRFLKGGEVTIEATRSHEDNYIVAKLLWGRDFGMDLTKLEEDKKTTTCSEKGCDNPVSEDGETCPQCEKDLTIIAKEDDAFDERMGLDEEMN